MQIAVHHFDAGSIVVHLHDNDRDRIIELHGNVMCFNGKVVGIDHKRPDDH